MASNSETLNLIEGKFLDFAPNPGERMKIKRMHLFGLGRDESGQELMEYALLAAMIAFGAVTAVHGLANDIASGYSTVASKLSSAIGAADQGGQGGGGGESGAGDPGGGAGLGGASGEGGQGGQGGGRGGGRG